MKTLLPLIISGFVLCGFFAVCLSAALLPRSEPESESESVSEFDLFPPFQPVYLDTTSSSNFQFIVSVPLKASAYDFVWSYSAFGRSFMPASLPISVFSPHGNFITYKPDKLYDLYSYCAFYIKCDVFEIGTSNLLHTYYFSYQFFDLPLSYNNSSKSALKKSIDEPEPEPETEDDPQQQPQEEINTDTVRKEIFKTIDEYMESDDIVLSCQDCKFDRKSCDDYECDWKNYKYYREYKKIIEEELNK